MDKFLTVRDVSNVLGVKKFSTVRVMIAEGHFPNAISLSSSYLIPRRDVVNVLSRRKVGFISGWK